MTRTSLEGLPNATIKVLILKCHVGPIKKVSKVVIQVKMKKMYLNRTGNLISELVCKSRMKRTDLERHFTVRIEDEAILCTDTHKSYIQFGA